MVNSVNRASGRGNEKRRRNSQRFQEHKLPPSHNYTFGSKLTGYFCKYPECKTPCKSFKLPSLVKKHARNHYTPVICPLCEERTAEQGDMERHVRVYHPSLAASMGISGEYLHCSICPKAISNSRKDNFKRHMSDSHKLEIDEQGRWVPIAG